MKNITSIIISILFIFISGPAFSDQIEFTCSLRTIKDGHAGFHFSFTQGKQRVTSGRIVPFGFAPDYGYSENVTRLQRLEEPYFVRGPLGMCRDDQRAVLFAGKDASRNQYDVQLCIEEDGSISINEDRSPQVSVNDRAQHWPADAPDAGWEYCE